MCLLSCLHSLPEYHDLSSCGGAVQAVEEAEEALQGAARLAAAVDSLMAVLATVADLSYAWTLVDEYTIVMQVRTASWPCWRRWLTCLTLGHW